MRILFGNCIVWVFSFNTLRFCVAFIRQNITFVIRDSTSHSCNALLCYLSRYRYCQIVKVAMGVCAFVRVFVFQEAEAGLKKKYYNSEYSDTVT